ncbi:MAG TPA: zf-HC2 domain-containing protein [Candidatus Binatia bacterium]
MTVAGHPTGEDLSRLVDGELAGAERTALEEHLGGCSACRASFDALAQADTALRRSARTSAAARRVPERGAGCLPEGTLVALAHGALDPSAAEHAELHLARCDACLVAAGEAIALRRALATASAVAVPEALKSRVASRWTPAEEKKTAAGVVVRLVRGALELVERTLGEGILGIEPLAVATPVVRGTNGSPLSFVIRAPGAEIRATLVPDGDVVALTLALRDLDGRGLAGQRVALRRQRRAIFSARTDETGELSTPNLERGVYEVSCPGIATDFRLDLRS